MIHQERVISSKDTLPGLVSQALADLPKSTHLLDIGAGDGRLSDVLASSRPDIRVTGVEYDQKLALDSSESSGSPNNDLVVGDARSLPFKNEVFGAIAAINTLHEVIDKPDDEARSDQLDYVIAGLARVMNRDGTLIIYDGLMPDEQNEPVLLHPKTEEDAMLFKRFKEEYLARPPEIKPSGTHPETYESNVASVVTFLTKYHYLTDGSAWEGERRQLYPFTDITTIEKTMSDNGLEVADVKHPENKNREGLRELLANYAITKASDGQSYSAATFPSCQMLITARKT